MNEPENIEDFMGGRQNTNVELMIRVLKMMEVFLIITIYRRIKKHSTISFLGTNFCKAIKT